MKWLRIFEKKKSIYSKIVLNYIFSRLQKILKTNNVISGDINYTNECKSLQNLKCVKSKHYIKSVRIRSVSGRHSVRIRENADQKSSEDGILSRCERYYLKPTVFQNCPLHFSIFSFSFICYLFHLYFLILFLLLYFVLYIFSNFIFTN